MLKNIDLVKGKARRKDAKNDKKRERERKMDGFSGSSFEKRHFPKKTERLAKIKIILTAFILCSVDSRMEGNKSAEEVTLPRPTKVVKRIMKK